MNSRKISAVLSLLLVTGGCVGGRPIGATTYGPMRVNGGYKKKEIEPGVWRVTGNGNLQAGAGFGTDVALYRSAELMKSHGFSHMQILDHDGEQDVMYNVGVSREELKLTVKGTNDPAAPLSCRSASPETCTTVSVDRVIAEVGPRLAFRKGHPAHR